MRVTIVRPIDCGTYKRVSRFTDDAKPTRRCWEGMDKAGRRLKKKLYECRQSYKCMNKTDFLVRLDEEHNYGNADEYMPLKAFVKEYAV